MKKIIILILLSFIFSGCVKNESIDKYNKLSYEIKENIDKANENLLIAIDLFNKQNYTESKEKAINCEKDFEKSKEKNDESEKIAVEGNFSNWFIDYKKILSEQILIRKKQCDFLKNACTEINDDFEEAIKKINDIKTLDIEYKKLENTIKDIQNQNKNYFEK